MKIVAAVMAVILLAQVGTANENSSWAGLEDLMHPLKMLVEKLNNNFVSNQIGEAKNGSNMIGSSTMEKPLREIENSEQLNEPLIVENNSGTSVRTEEKYITRSEEIHGQSTTGGQSNTGQSNTGQGNTGQDAYNKVTNTNIQTSTGKTIIVTKVVVSRSRTGELERTVSTGMTNQNTASTTQNTVIIANQNTAKANSSSGESNIKSSSTKSSTEQLEPTVNATETNQNTTETNQNTTETNQNTNEANSSSGENRVEISTVNGSTSTDSEDGNTSMYSEDGNTSMYSEDGNASMCTEGDNASVIMDGDNMTVIYTTNSSCGW